MKTAPAVFLFVLSRWTFRRTPITSEIPKLYQWSPIMSSFTFSLLLIRPWSRRSQFDLNNDHINYRVRQLEWPEANERLKVAFQRFPPVTHHYVSRIIRLITFAHWNRISVSHRFEHDFQRESATFLIDEIIFITTTVIYDRSVVIFRHLRICGELVLRIDFLHLVVVTM